MPMMPQSYFYQDIGDYVSAYVLVEALLLMPPAEFTPEAAQADYCMQVAAEASTFEHISTYRSKTKLSSKSNYKRLEWKQVLIKFNTKAHTDFPFKILFSIHMSQNTQNGVKWV